MFNKNNVIKLVVLPALLGLAAVLPGEVCHAAAADHSKDKPKDGQELPEIKKVTMEPLGGGKFSLVVEAKSKEPIELIRFVRGDFQGIEQSELVKKFETENTGENLLRLKGTWDDSVPGYNQEMLKHSFKYFGIKTKTGVWSDIKDEPVFKFAPTVNAAEVAEKMESSYCGKVISGKTQPLTAQEADDFIQSYRIVHVAMKNGMIKDKDRMIIMLHLAAEQDQLKPWLRFVDSVEPDDEYRPLTDGMLRNLVQVYLRCKASDLPNYSANKKNEDLLLEKLASFAESRITARMEIYRGLASGGLTGVAKTTAAKIVEDAKLPTSLEGVTSENLAVTLQLLRADDFDLREGAKRKLTSVVYGPKSLQTETIGKLRGLLSDKDADVVDKAKQILQAIAPEDDQEELRRACLIVAATNKAAAEEAAEAVEALKVQHTGNEKAAAKEGSDKKVNRSPAVLPGVIVEPQTPDADSAKEKK